ncbi:DUF2946 domain-containing protein [Pseudomonas sp. MWU13-2100]|uniref:DUF2946 domain-containing protein n=1 Tax=Pseudomonas sp. MWU13-2100 TaxID=2935075 RepID=UPI00200DE1B3|nr:DUF2946 domain-containing protein [Pseudomonas sp. MWU13-2100]
MSRQRLAIAWIACFAVLFNLLAMPMSGAMAQASENSIPEQLLWGSFCSASGTRLVAIDLGKLEQQAPQNDDHSNMQHCWCCAGHASLLALPGHIAQLPLVQSETLRARHATDIAPPTPRQQWPSLNPRASPLA